MTNYVTCQFVLTVQGSQFSVNEVEVVMATVDLDEVVRYRGRQHFAMLCDSPAQCIQHNACSLCHCC